jgi:hypothetical protein
MSENSGSHPPGDARDYPGLYRDIFNLVQPLMSKLKVYSYKYSASTSGRTQFATVMSTDVLNMYREIMTSLWEKAAKEIGRYTLRINTVGFTLKPDDTQARTNP